MPQGDVWVGNSPTQYRRLRDAALVTAPTTGGAARDVLRQPFLTSSIWNTPIGSDATTTSAGLSAANGYLSRVTTDDVTVGMETSLPLKTLTSRNNVTPNFIIPAGTRVRVKPDASITDSTPGNRIMALLDSDNVSYWDGQYVLVSPGGDPSVNYVIKGEGSGEGGKTSLYGSGRLGLHGGSALSGLGGLLRAWEWNDDSVAIRHVLSMNLYGVRFMSTASSGFRWPATKADSGYNVSDSGNFYGRTGTFDGMGMGTLLRLPPAYNVAGITNVKARRIATALRDFGAYVVDNTAWDVHAFSVEKGIEGAFASAGATFHAELMAVITALHYVTNNSPSTIGGPGARVVTPVAEVSL